MAWTEDSAIWIAAAIEIALIIMTTALTVYERMNELQVAARAMQSSGFFAVVKSEAQALVKVMAGAEIGLPPFAAMTGIHFCF